MSATEVHWTTGLIRCGDQWRHAGASDVVCGPWCPEHAHLWGGESYGLDLAVAVVRYARAVGETNRESIRDDYAHPAWRELHKAFAAMMHAVPKDLRP